MTDLEFLCPNCRTLLSNNREAYSCPKCGKEWRQKNGVLVLSESPSYWNLLSSQKMSKLLADAKQKGWREAFTSSDDRETRRLLPFTDSPTRADGTFYLSLNEQSTVLDLGAGFGSYTFALSPRVKQVVPADSNYDSLEFIGLRAAQDKISNILPVQIEPLDSGKLPFQDNMFDAVIMNGVLEWVGSYSKKGDPLRIQKKCLKEVSRILKPGGEAWIGIENRFGLRYFLGAPDDHLKYYSPDKEIAYTTLWPRFIANMITQKELGLPYRTYTHSIWGIKRMLKRAGLREIEFYYPEEDYRALSTKIYPVESREVKKIIDDNIGDNKWLGILKAMGLQSALCDSYFILARKVK